MTYLVKRLQHQELGSVNGPNDNPARGRYLYIANNPDFLSHLPFLSQTILNDYRILTLIPLYKNYFERNYCTFVYHNDRFHGVGMEGNQEMYTESIRIDSSKIINGCSKETILSF
jgi:hypothetical protein